MLDFTAKTIDDEVADVKDVVVSVTTTVEKVEDITLSTIDRMIDDCDKNISVWEANKTALLAKRALIATEAAKVSLKAVKPVKAVEEVEVS